MFNNQLDIQQNDRQTKGNKSPSKTKRVYILNYSPEKIIDTKKNKWDLTETKHQKRIDLLLKKQNLKERNPQLIQSASKDINQRNNIDRFMNIIIRSRNFDQNNDSGCEKMIRALGKLLNKFYQKNEKKTILHLAFQSLKKYTMTCSSNNYQLFLQSRHNILKQTCKQVVTPPKEQKLEQINENIDEQPVNSDSSQFPSKSLQQIQSPIDKLVIQLQKNNTIDFRKYQTPKKLPIYTGTSLTTLQDITFSCNKTPKTYKSFIAQSKSINLFLSKACPIITKIDKSIEAQIFTNDEQTNQTKPFEKDIVERQNKQEQIEEMKNQIKMIAQFTLQSLKKSILKKETNKNIKNSLSLSQIYAIPVQMNHQKQIGNSPTSIARQQQTKLVETVPQKIVKNKTEQLKQTKQKEKNPFEYAQIMIGQTQNQNNKKIESVQTPKPKPTVFQQVKRQRMNSLPKITFTYTSRQKNNGLPHSPPKIIPTTPKAINQYKNNIHPNKINISKNKSQDELQSTFQSKRGRTNSRFNQNIQQIHYNNAKKMTIPLFHQRINISPSPRPPISIDNCNKYTLRTQYYGDCFQIKKKQPTNFQVSRPRIITFQHKNNKQYGILRPNTHFNIGQKETRSISLNERVLFGTNNSPKAWS